MSFNKDGAHTRATHTLHTEIEALKDLSAKLYGAVLIYESFVPSAPRLGEENVSKHVPDWRERIRKPWK